VRERIKVVPREDMIGISRDSASPEGTRQPAENRQSSSA
jgi:hypothetical protein